MVVATVLAPEDQERLLVERARRRDPEAFAALYDRHLDAVYRYLYYRVGDNSVCEDLTEQVFLKAWEGIHRYEWRGRPFLAWLYRVAHNTLVDYRRAERPVVSLETVPVEPKGEGDEALASALTAQQLSEALAQITPQQAQVIELRFLEGWSNAEIAARMQRQEPAVRALQLRGLSALRRILTRESA